MSLQLTHRLLRQTRSHQSRGLLRPASIIGSVLRATSRSPSTPFYYSSSRPSDSRFFSTRLSPRTPGNGSKVVSPFSDDKQILLPTIVIDKYGQHQQLEMAKYEIAAKYNLEVRDLRILDGSLRSYPTILARKSAILINLDLVRAIITPEATLLFDPIHPVLHSLVPQLQAHLRETFGRRPGETTISPGSSIPHPRHHHPLKQQPPKLPVMQPSDHDLQAEEDEEEVVQTSSSSSSSVPSSTTTAAAATLTTTTTTAPSQQQQRSRFAMRRYDESLNKSDATSSSSSSSTSTTTPPSTAAAAASSSTSQTHSSSSSSSNPMHQTPDGLSRVSSGNHSGLTFSSASSLRHSFETTFEFIVLEYLLWSVCDSLEKRYKSYFDTVGPLLDAAAHDEGKTLMALLPLKFGLTSYSVSVKEIGDALRTVLKNDEDMADMYLSTYAKGIRRPKEQHQEIEVLLETYLRKVEEIENEVKNINDNIVATEHIIQIQLDSTRNQIMQVDLLLTIVTCGLASGSLIAGVFGMNLLSRMETHPLGFYLVAASAVSMATLMIRTGVRMCRSRNINLLERRPRSRLVKLLRFFFSGKSE